MKQFLAIYTGSASSPQKVLWTRLPDAERTSRESSGMKAWGEWLGRNRERIRDSGGPLGSAKLASAQGVSDATSALAAYVIVSAESHEEAARMFVDHPHFTIFPGTGVEIMECLPIPASLK